MTWPIFIPSKGRPSCPTLKTLRALGTTATLVIEPQDEPAYREAWPLVSRTVLPANDRGIFYVRNYILAMARAKGLGWFWMMDDDIAGFFFTRENKNVRAEAATVLDAAQGIIGNDSEFVAQGALEYQQYSWSAKKELIEGSYADVCVAIHAERSSPFTYRTDCIMKEDRDFTMQLIAGGRVVRRCARLSFACPKNGSNEGGLSKEYATSGREASSAHRLAEIWPGVVTVQTKPDGRVDAKIDWKKLRPS